MCLMSLHGMQLWLLRVNFLAISRALERKPELAVEERNRGRMKGVNTAEHTIPNNTARADTNMSITLILIFKACTRVTKFQIVYRTV